MQALLQPLSKLGEYEEIKNRIEKNPVEPVIYWPDGIIFFAIIHCLALTIHT